MTAETPAHQPSRVIDTGDIGDVVLELAPQDLLDQWGFAAGTLCEHLPHRFGASIPAGAPTQSDYPWSRHLLRHLVVEHVLPLLSWSPAQVIEQESAGSPIRLWLFDDDGCPMRRREEEVRALPPVRVRSDEIANAVRDIYPLRRNCEVALYDALGFPCREHRRALALLRPFVSFDDDVLHLAAEIYAAEPSGSPVGSIGEPSAASRLLESVGSARLLLA